MSGCEMEKLDTDSKHSVGDNWQESIKNNKEKMGYILQHQIATDLILKVGEKQEEFNCHRIVLIMGSTFFESLLSARWTCTGNGRESINLPEIEPDEFRIILKFLYTETFEIPNPSMEICLSILKLANVYLMSALRENCLEYLLKSQGLLNADNAIRVFEEAVRLSEDKLEKLALGKISSTAINSDEFLQLSHESLCRFLKTKYISIPEIEIFEAVRKWADQHCVQKSLEVNPQNIRSVLGEEALHMIRFPIISPDIFATRVAPTGILSMEERMEILTYYSMDVETKRKIEKLSYFKTKPRIFYNTLLRFEDIGTDLFDYSTNWRNLVFQVNRPILIYSLGFYGPESTHLPCNYNIELTIRENHNSENWRSDPLMGSLVETVQRAANEPREIFHIKFAEPVRLGADKEYLISFLIRGPKTRTGDVIRDIISTECGHLGIVTFKFGEAKYKNNRYQIPEICFAFID
jgi:hypothetical protein